MSNQSFPLCVDLDGTLIASDSLWESILWLMKHRLPVLARLPFWLLGGKARFKRQIAEHTNLDPASLPYRQDVLNFLGEEHKAGRKLVLVTAADERIAQSVARHLGLFDEVLASDGARNLRGRTKAGLLSERYGAKKFDYVADGGVDLPVWEQAHAAVVVGGDALCAAVQKCTTLARQFPVPPGGWRATLKAMRVFQWVKNLLIFVPALVGHRLGEAGVLQELSVAFLAFSWCASAIYILNDLSDLATDRRHPTKRRRPFASGALSIPLGLALAGMLLVAGVGLSLASLHANFTLILVAYILITKVYTLFARQVAVLDVMVLAGLYTIRLLAGGIAAGVTLSFWLLAFSVFMFLSLAFLKRYTELAVWEESGQQAAGGRSYEYRDREWLASAGTVAGYISTLVFAFYINSDSVVSLYGQPKVLWLIFPVLLFWITRLWFRAHRRAIADDPIVAALQDRATYVVVLAIIVIWVLAL